MSSPLLHFPTKSSEDERWIHDLFIMRGVLITGATGSGKSCLTYNIMRQLAEKDVPFIALKTTDTDFSTVSCVIPNLTSFNTNVGKGIPLSFSILVPPKGVRIADHHHFLSKMLTALISRDTDTQTQLFTIVMEKALATCRKEYGWQDNNTFGDIDTKPIPIAAFLQTLAQCVANLRLRNKDELNNLLQALSEQMASNACLNGDEPLSQVVQDTSCASIYLDTTIEWETKYFLSVIIWSQLLEISQANCMPHHLSRVLIVDSVDPIHKYLASKAELYQIFETLTKHAYENGSGLIYVAQTLRHMPPWLIERAGAYLMFRSYECLPSKYVRYSEKIQECLHSLSLGEFLGVCSLWTEEFIALKIPEIY